MKNTVVRLEKIEIENLKNVKKGELAFQGWQNIKKNVKSNSTDMLGIYGQNGSGKTAVIDALNILRNIVSGKELDKEIESLIRATEDRIQLSFTFHIEQKREIESKSFLVSYTINVGKLDNNKLCVTKEKVLFSQLVEEKWSSQKVLIDYDIEYGENVIKPKYRYNEIIKNKEHILGLNLAKALSQKVSTSFIFSSETLNILNDSLEKDLILILQSIKFFTQLNLIIFSNNHLSVVNMNEIIPLSIRLENEEDLITGAVAVKLFEQSVIDKEKFKVLSDVMDQINIVINALIPDLNISIMNYGDQLMDDGKIGVKVELISIRKDLTIPLKCESDGIKKIISILSALIAMYNNPSICLAIDELDAGIFEYLLGELLEVLQKNAKGQFIFTSHNLRALEKMNKDSILFTTTNPENRYIRLSNVKNNNNLRDFYLRGIMLGGQKECIYQETNSYEISYAFRRAWEN